ncbi:hypothetical protein SDJN02_08549, partial [Cucurbita argyrosperma subsp. argyrosperma]
MEGVSVGRGRRKTVQLGALGGKRRNVWQFKVSPKLRRLRRLPSLKKLLIWLRDSYMNAMLAFASSRVVGCGGGSGDGVWAGAGGRATLKEYDEEMITEIYKSLVVAQARLPPPESVRPSWVGGRLPAVAE